MEIIFYTLGFKEYSPHKNLFIIFTTNLILRKIYIKLVKMTIQLTWR